MSFEVGKKMLKNLNNANKITAVLSVALLILMVLGCSLFRGNFNSSSPNQSSTPYPTPTPTPDLYAEESKMQNAFDEKESQFTKMPSKTQLVKEPYIKGKAAFYSEQKEIGDKTGIWLLDNRLTALDTSGFEKSVKDVTAQTPDEVQTIVLRKCQQVFKGNYVVEGRTIPGYIWRCDLTIIDRELEAVVFRKNFQSKLETEVSVLAGDEEIDAGIPYDKIYEFLGGLPRK